MSAGDNGSWVSLSTGKRKRANGWTRAAPSSELPCSSQCRCWWRGLPQFRQRWRTRRQSRTTSRKSKCTSCHRRVYHWGLPHCWRCRQLCLLCCSDLIKTETRKRIREREGHGWIYWKAYTGPVSLNLHNIQRHVLNRKREFKKTTKKYIMTTEIQKVYKDTKKSIFSPRDMK